METAALIATRHGGPEVLEVRREEVGDPAPGEVRVRVTAAGVNFVDIYQRQGTYPTDTPFLMANEGAGTVEAIGEGVTEVAAGDRVAWAMHRGAAAGVVLVPADVLVPVPDGLDLEIAAASMLQGMTAHYLTTSTYTVQPGDLALVHAAAGGVGQLLVQMVTSRGGTVVATAGTDEKLAIAHELGAAHGINYGEVDDLAAAVQIAAGRGMDVVYDGVGAATFEASLDSLRPRGMMVLFGGASGQVPPFDLQELNRKGSLFITRPTLADYVATREELLDRGSSVLGDVAAGALGVQVGGRWPLAEAAAAYEALEGRRTTGKLLLLP